MATGWSSQVSSSFKPIQPIAITASLQTLYTASANTANILTGYATAELKSLSITNTTGSAITFNVYIIPSGGTAGTGNAYFYGMPIAANDAKLFQGLTEAMAAGDFIQVSASTTGITIRGSVNEVQ